MRGLSKRDYFDSTWKDVDIALVPIKFSITSKRIRNKFIKLLAKNKSIADLGCGSGGNAIFFQKINPNIKYTGIDISKNAITKAKAINNNKNTNFIVDDLEKNNLLKNYFSMVFCSQLIEHFKEDEKFLAKIYQSLKPNGTLLLSTVYRTKTAIWLYKNSRGERVLAPDHINEYTNVSNLLNKLKRCGFRIIDYDLTMFRYPIIDIGLRFLMKYFKSKFVIKLVNSPLIMSIRYYFVVPIFGFYNFQILAKKNNSL